MGRRSGPHRKKDQKKYKYKKKYKTPNIALSPTNGPDHTGRKTRLFCPPLKVTRSDEKRNKEEEEEQFFCYTRRRTKVHQTPNITNQTVQTTPEERRDDFGHHTKGQEETRRGRRSNPDATYFVQYSQLIRENPTILEIHPPDNASKKVKLRRSIKW